MQYSECYGAITWLTYRLALSTWHKTGCDEDGQAARVAHRDWAQAALGLQPDEVPEPSHKWKKVP